MLPRVIRESGIRPFDPFMEFFDGPIFKPICDPGWGRREARGMMKIDVKDEGASYTVYVDLPGCKKDDIKLELDDGVLKITAKREHEVDKKDNNGYVCCERFSGECSRTIGVGEVKEEDIKAKFEDGVLKLTFPKKSEPERKLIAID